MSRWFLGVGPALLLVSCAVAMAQDPSGAVPVASAPTGMPSADFLLSMGPYGALVWGAYLLGKGVKAANVETMGAGKTQPIKSCDDKLGRKKLIECLAPNRRVTVDVKGPAK